ncbi:MAG TPA: hypothetical protein VLU95_05555 [Candidatus Acidoferrum sp.]|nr:hypothetical protein [Candidatus Acidoferrum sp.]
MGEEAARESISCNNFAEIYFQLDGDLHDIFGTARLRSLSADKLICVHGNASGYNNCKNDSTFGDALMTKCADINGEMPIGF